MNGPINLNLKKHRTDPHLPSCLITITEIGFGQWQYTCWSKKYSSPVGFAWVEVVDNAPCRANLRMIFTHPYNRGFGVASRIHDEIMRTADIIETGVGSTEGGFALLKSKGYEQDRRRGVWVFDKRKKPSRRSARVRGDR